MRINFYIFKIIEFKLPIIFDTNCVINFFRSNEKFILIFEVIFQNDQNQEVLFEFLIQKCKCKDTISYESTSTKEDLKNSLETPNRFRGTRANSIIVL